MNVLFLSIGRLNDLTIKSLYPDLLREIKAKGHNVYAVSPLERRFNKNTALSNEAGINILRVKIGNITKVNVIEKGISTLLIERQFLSAIKKYFKGVKFDLVIYTTPPITFANVISYIKKRDNAKTYLILKDIFPQNAVDLGMFSKSSLFYRFFRRKEKKLYAVSDYIGCMSEANVDYVIKHNPEVVSEKVEVCPNAIEIVDMALSGEQICEMRSKYGIPLDKTVFVYGGNLGKPQGVPFLIECLKSQKENSDAYFLIVGSGTEFKKLEAWFEEEKPENMKLLGQLPKEDYDRMVASCDVGMIFLDYRFTIPNFPSRLLAYMQAGIPVLACTDPNTDVGKVITEGGFGWWCESNSVEDFCDCVRQAVSEERAVKGQNAMKYLVENYTVDKATDIIFKSAEKDL